MTRAGDAGDRRRRADEHVIASIVVGALVVGGVVVLARSPRVRRLAWTGARFALTTWLPAWGITQLRAAWTETAPVDADLT